MNQKMTQGYVDFAVTAWCEKYWCSDINADAVAKGTDLPIDDVQASLDRLVQAGKLKEMVYH